MQNNVAIYTRTAQKDIEGINAQISRLVQEVLEDHGEASCKIHLFIDNGHSGFERNRAGYQALIDEMTRDGFDAVYVTDISRLARNLDILQDVIHITKTFDIPVIQINSLEYADSRTN